jgi:hypothetical protein
MPTAHYIPRSLLNDNGLSSLSLPSAVSSKPEASTNAGVSDARSIECETRSRNIPTINVTINVGEGMHDPTDMTTITDNTSDHVSKMNQPQKSHMVNLPRDYPQAGHVYSYVVRMGII